MVSAQHFKAMNINQLRRNAIGIEGVSIVEDGDVGKTIEWVLRAAEEEEVIVICGSFFIMGEAKGYFYPQEIERRLDPSIL